MSSTNPEDQGQVIDALSAIYLASFREQIAQRFGSTDHRIPGGSCVHLIAPAVAAAIEPEIFSFEMAATFSRILGNLRASEGLSPECPVAPDMARAALRTACGATNLPFRLTDMATHVALSVDAAQPLRI